MSDNPSSGDEAIGIAIGNLAANLATALGATGAKDSAAVFIQMFDATNQTLLGPGPLLTAINEQVASAKAMLDHM